MSADSSHGNDSHQRFEHLVFDLDDTLVDTSTTLIPNAMREASQAMISAGLNATLEQCLQAREEHAANGAPGELFEHIVSRFGILQDGDLLKIKRAGWQAFYGRRVTETIDLFPGVRDMLKRLSQKYRLALVTAGVRDTQIEKTRLLRLETIFADIRIVDPSQGETKRDAFLAIMRDTGANSDRYLSIGNRLDTDIIPAREIGWRGCWIRYGEHASQLPRAPAETPDFAIDHIAELVDTCRL